MKIPASISPIVLRKAATLVLLTLSVASFATLGEGGKKNLSRTGKNLLSARSAAINYKTFTLRSGYDYRGSKVLGNTVANNYIIFNNVITVEKGNQTYIVPMKRKVLLDRITFKPTASRY